MTLPGEAESRSAVVAAHYDQAASRYDSAMRLFERWFVADGRRWAAGQVGGDVLEIGVGTGRNLAFYPRAARLVGVDVSPEMLALARQRAKSLGLAADLRIGDAQALEFGDATFDCVVSTFVLCSVPAIERSIAEVARVLRLGGTFVLLEHVRSPSWPVQVVQRVLDPLMVRLEHDHLLRDPLDHLQQFQIVSCERSKWGVIERLVARKPDC